MANSQNRITSVDQFRHELRAVLERARKNLERDDGLANVALLHGHPGACKKLLLLNIPSNAVNARLKLEVQHGNYESVVFVTLAAWATRGPSDAPTLYRATSSLSDLGIPLDEAKLCVVVEGSHRDFGTHAAHIEFRREGENRFVFGKSDCGPLTGGVLNDLWPKRKLNS